MEFFVGKALTFNKIFRESTRKTHLFTKFFRDKPIFFVGRPIFLWKSSGVNAILRNSSKARKKGKSSTRRLGEGGTDIERNSLI